MPYRLFVARLLLDRVVSRLLLSGFSEYESIFLFFCLFWLPLVVVFSVVSCTALPLIFIDFY